MARRPLAADPPVEVEDRQIEAWRLMSSVEKAAPVSGLTHARRAVLTLGPELAGRAYPDARSLPES